MAAVPEPSEHARDRQLVEAAETVNDLGSDRSGRLRLCGAPRSALALQRATEAAITWSRRAHAVCRTVKRTWLALRRQMSLTAAEPIQVERLTPCRVSRHTFASEVHLSGVGEAAGCTVAVLSVQFSERKAAIRPSASTALPGQSRAFLFRHANHCALGSACTLVARWRQTTGWQCLSNARSRDGGRRTPRHSDKRGNNA